MRGRAAPRLLTLVPPFASDAFVLRTHKLGETSKVVVLLTRDRGKLRAVARGARGPRSRYQSALEPLSEVRVTLYGRQGAELYRLGGCELMRSAFRAGSLALNNALSLSYYAELLEAFSQEGEAEDAVYRLARAVLEAVEEGGASELLSRYMEAWLLKLHGLYPPLDRCAGCGGALPAGDLRYDSRAHGFVCASCSPASGPVLPAAARDRLGRIFRQSPSQQGESAAPAAEAALASFHRQLITRHLERDLHSYRVLGEMAREGVR